MFGGIWLLVTQTCSCFVPICEAQRVWTFTSRCHGRVRWLGGDVLATSGDCLRVPISAVWWNIRGNKYQITRKIFWFEEFSEECWHCLTRDVHILWDEFRIIFHMNQLNVARETRIDESNLEFAGDSRFGYMLPFVAFSSGFVLVNLLKPSKVSSVSSDQILQQALHASNMFVDGGILEASGSHVTQKSP